MNAKQRSETMEILLSILSAHARDILQKYIDTKQNGARFFPRLLPRETQIYVAKHESAVKLWRLFSGEVLASPRPSSRTSTAHRTSSLSDRDDDTGDQLSASESLLAVTSGRDSRLDTFSPTYITSDQDDRLAVAQALQFLATPTSHIVGLVEFTDVKDTYHYVNNVIAEIDNLRGTHAKGNYDGILQAVREALIFIIQFEIMISSAHIMFSNDAESATDACSQFIKFLAEYLVLLAYDLKLKEFSLDKVAGHPIDEKYYVFSSTNRVDLDKLTKHFNYFANLMRLMIDLHTQIANLHDKSLQQKREIFTNLLAYANCVGAGFSEINNLSAAGKLRLEELYLLPLIPGYIQEIADIRVRLERDFPREAQARLDAELQNPSPMPPVDQDVLFAAAPRKMPSGLTVSSEEGGSTEGALPRKRPSGLSNGSGDSTPSRLISSSVPPDGRPKRMVQLYELRTTATSALRTDTSTTTPGNVSSSFDEDAPVSPVPFPTLPPP